MFVYEKKLQYPIKITTPNPKLAAIIITQYGGPYINKLYKIEDWLILSLSLILTFSVSA